MKFRVLKNPNPTCFFCENILEIKGDFPGIGVIYSCSECHAEFTDVIE